MVSVRSFVTVVLSASCVCCVLSCGGDDDASSKCSKGDKTFHEFEDRLLLGENLSLSKYKGQIVLLTNVASFWGITVEQYKQLNALVDYFGKKSCPLRVLGVPCNQFGLQEPGEGIEIVNTLKFVRPGDDFEPKFDLLAKRKVNGDEEDKLFKWIKVTAIIYHYVI